MLRLDFDARALQRPLSSAQEGSPMLVLWWMLAITDVSAGKKKPPPAAPPPPAGDTLTFDWAPGSTATYSSIRTLVLNDRSTTETERGTLLVMNAQDDDSLIITPVDVSRHTDSLGTSPAEQAALAARDALPAPPPARVGPDGYWRGVVDDDMAYARAILAAADAVRTAHPGPEGDAAIQQHLDLMALSNQTHEAWELFPGGFLERFLPAGAPLVQQASAPTLVGVLPVQVTVQHNGTVPCSDSGPGTAVQCVRVRLWIELDADAAAPLLAPLIAQGGAFSTVTNIEWRLDPRTLHPWWESFSESTQVTVPGQAPLSRMASRQTTYTWQ